MNNEEAIKVLKHTVGNINWDAERKEIYFTDEWVQAYEMAIAALRERKSPCDLCRYNPPSSCDGKPCTMCPASPEVDV